MYIYLLFFLLNSEITSNFGSNYLASSTGGRATYALNEAIVINPANLVLNDIHSFTINSYYKDSYYGLGTSLNFSDGFGVFFSLDELDTDFSYDSYSAFLSYGFNVGKRFSLGASLGYFSSNLYTSELKYTGSASFSPWSLKKKYNKWLISIGFLKGFSTDNKNEAYISYSYIHKVFSLSVDYISSDFNNTSDSNSQVFALKFFLTDTLELVSSFKVYDLQTEDNAYGVGFNYIVDSINFGFSYFNDINFEYYGISLSFLGE